MDPLRSGLLTASQEGGADPNQPGAWGLTPLMYGAVYGRDQAVAAILSTGGAGIDLHATDAHGNDALRHAQWSGSSDVERLLKEHAAMFELKRS